MVLQNEAVKHCRRETHSTIKTTFSFNNRRVSFD